MVGSHENWGIFKGHKWGELLRHSQLDTIEDFVVRAERDIVEGEEPIAACVALVELAAAAMADVFLNAENPELTPELVIEMASGRMASKLMAEVERSDLLHKPHLTVAEPVSGEPPQ